MPAFTKAELLSARPSSWRWLNNDRRVLIAGSLHPEYRQVLETYFHRLGTDIVVAPADDGAVSPESVRCLLDSDTTAVVMQQPNFFGCLEDVQTITKLAHDVGALSILAFDSVSPGLLKRPADYGVDCRCRRAASGHSASVRGTVAGMFTAVAVRSKMPGRSSETRDRNGRECYALNLQAA